jgi:hypothetical protein
MSTTAYNEILSRAQSELTPQERERLIQELHCATTGPRHSITELKGLGKEVWEGIDPVEYVRKERDSWDG